MKKMCAIIISIRTSYSYWNNTASGAHFISSTTNFRLISCHPKTLLNPKIPLGLRIEQCFWVTGNKPKICSGEIVHKICIPTIQELERIITASKDEQNALFHNKYFMEQDHAMMDCMEERLIARNKNWIWRRLQPPFKFWTDKVSSTCSVVPTFESCWTRVVTRNVERIFRTRSVIIN